MSAGGVELVVLGLDPGSRFTGWGLVAERSGVLSLVDAGVLSLGSGDVCQRLGRIYAELADLIAAHRPDEAAVENVFVSKNSQSAIKLGQARGAALAACAVAGVGVSHYQPSLVKKSLVGTGRADKSQVAFMVGRLLGVKPDWREDASDALAVAVCHLNQRRLAKMMETA
ncbi:crossover junction endodeoxyribonuclease RuvC [Desulfohalovibrio reitneri]|uniref:crossover junction endodeoxyribonuclease RuvC n=1 Tax=Desulfohalovibrio reitneri TaxID=1307759 RepID=UPI0004A75B06|nr:crossover junction endodeoxyribonuclease RuvC [Desulfohalovibrio reitneri]